LGGLFNKVFGLLAGELLVDTFVVEVIFECMVDVLRSFDECRSQIFVSSADHEFGIVA